MYIFFIFNYTIQYNTIQLIFFNQDMVTIYKYAVIYQFIRSRYFVLPTFTTSPDKPLYRVERKPGERQRVVNGDDTIFEL